MIGLSGFGFIKCNHDAKLVCDRCAGQFKAPANDYRSCGHDKPSIYCDRCVMWPKENGITWVAHAHEESENADRLYLKVKREKAESAVEQAYEKKERNMEQMQTDHPYEIGKNYFIRTVTHHHTGKLVKVTSQELVLVDAAWIADDGRFMNALRKGTLSEVEPFPEGKEVIVGRNAVIDATEWIHPLPRVQK